jgi:hypothetical protein
MGRWSILSGPAAGGYSAELSHGRGRKFTARLTDPSDLSFSINARLAEAATIEELSTDLHVLWQDSGTVWRLYRGRAGTSGDSGDEDSHTVNVTSLDYRGVLMRRRLYSTSSLSYGAAVDQAEVARLLIQQTQTRTGGDMGIVKGIGNPTGVNATAITYAAGDSIGEKINDLAQMPTGFDWDITPADAAALHLDIWYPQRGVDRGVVLEYGGLVAKFARVVDSSTFANAIRETGADALAGREVEASDLATRPEGRWDAVYGDTTLLDQTALNNRADWQLAQAETITPTYTLTLKQGAWEGPGHIWLGDPVRVVIMSGRLAVDTVQRVHELAFTLNDDDPTGDATLVEVTTGGPRLDYRRVPRETARRLTNLERR